MTLVPAPTDWAGRTHAVGLNGTLVSYVDVGNAAPGAPTVLLLHGLGGSWAAWLRTIEPLVAAGHRVVAVDLPGFGATPPMPGVASVADYAGVVDRFCDRVGLDAVVAVGSSFGGWIAALLALANPARVEKLVLIDAAGISPTRRERMKVVGMLRMANRMAPWGCRHRDLLMRNLRLRKRALGFAVHRPELLSEDLVAALLPITPSPVFGLVLEAAVASWGQEFMDRAATLVLPTLIVWGECDKQLPLRHAQEWLRLIRGSTLALVPDAGHLPMLEAPALVNAAIEHFLGTPGGA